MCTCAAILGQSGRAAEPMGSLGTQHGSAIRGPSMDRSVTRQQITDTGHGIRMVAASLQKCHQTTADSRHDRMGIFGKNNRNHPWAIRDPLSGDRSVHGWPVARGWPTHVGSQETPLSTVGHRPFWPRMAEHNEQRAHVLFTALQPKVKSHHCTIPKVSLLGSVHSSMGNRTVHLTTLPPYPLHLDPHSPC